VLVKEGDEVAENDPLIVLESEKATLEVPSPAAGVIEKVAVSVGDKVAQGDLILTIAGGDGDGGGDADVDDEDEDDGDSADEPEATEKDTAAEAEGDEDAEDGDGEADADADADGGDADAGDGEEADAEPTEDEDDGEEASGDEDDASDDGDKPSGGGRSAKRAPAKKGAAKDEGEEAAPRRRSGDIHAGPAARRAARELGIDINEVTGSGRAGRITLEDVAKAAKDGGQGAQAAEGGGLAIGGLPAWPKVDFAAFGEVERVDLSRIAKIAGPALARNWVSIPHVTQFDEADITELEAFRKRVNEEHSAENVKVTMVSLLIKACAVALREFPHFNSSLDGDGLILKRYFNIGFAVDTPAGLMVPVIRDVDRKGLLGIARELTELSTAARDGKISREQMQGGTFTVSSLGGIGGTAFTPIINAPEVAILGVSRSQTTPVWDGRTFVPRLMLPISLSYDHRVIDGAAGARFCVRLTELLSDPREMLL